MALKRLYPEQDTFIVSASSELNFGADEILELGCTDFGEDPARILMQFSGDQIKSLIQNKDYTAILHLSLSEAENLSTQFKVVATTVPQEWAEGVGRTGDLETAGVTWNYTGKVDTQGNPIEWEEPGASHIRIFDGEYANRVSLRYTINNGTGGTNTFDGLQISGGGAQGWGTFNAEGILRTYDQGSYQTGTILADLELDVTRIVKAWEVGINAGLALQFEDELECLRYKSRLSFYSRNTHTIYRPYLEIRWDESEYLPGELTECKDLFGSFSNNLRKEYTVGDIVKIDLSVKDRYAPRVWSTGSIYQTRHVLPETSYWGIKDEYTNEMAIPFNTTYTRISADGSGSFFRLDTGNLEPERYYRLLIQVEKDDQRVVIDNRNIFRVNRNGKHQG